VPKHLESPAACCHLLRAKSPQCSSAASSRDACYSLKLAQLRRKLPSSNTPETGGSITPKDDTPCQTCHRRLQVWVRTGTLRVVLEVLAEDPICEVEANSTCRSASSTRPSQPRKRGLWCWQNQAWQGDQNERIK